MKKSHWTDTHSYIAASFLEKNVILFSLAKDDMLKQEIPYTYYTVLMNDKWLNADDTQWDVIGSAICSIPIKKVVTVSPNGDLYLVSKGSRTNERISDTCKITPEEYGVIRNINSIEGKAYVCGMNRQIYRRDDENLWNCISEEIITKKEWGVGFEAIGGFSDKNIYAVGWKGEIWNFDGLNWLKKDTLTNEILTDICCSDDGYVYCCGRNSTLIKGKNDKWEIIDLNLSSKNFWSIKWFQGSLYLSTSKTVFKLVNNQLTPIDFGEEDSWSCGKLTTDGNTLLSVGEKDVFSFDGKLWKRID